MHRHESPIIASLQIVNSARNANGILTFSNRCKTKDRDTILMLTKQLLHTIDIDQGATHAHNRK